MGIAGWWTVAVLVADLLIRLGLGVRVIMRRVSVGVSLAWLLVLLMFPVAGAFAYLLIGELRLGQRRAARAAQIHRAFQDWLSELKSRADVDWSVHRPACEALARLTETSIGIPPMPGNHVELLPDWETILRLLLRDIDAAKRTCHLEFYIWRSGGLGDEVAAALLRAAARGVTCRVLLDDVGSRDFLHSEWSQRLRAGGVALRGALPAPLWRLLFVRYDLRMHRKIAVIDGRLAYTGSLNLVDPRSFKQGAGLGQWVDAMVRIEGPAVEPLAITFLEDWAFESRERIDSLREDADVHPLRPRGPASVHVIPSGPAQHTDAIERILLTTIYTAQRELILTTPYFVPDESLLTALLAAAQRGVQVTLIVPSRVDSRVIRWASRAFAGDLVAAGVHVLLFEGGLLHTKSVTVDGEFSLFGSLNLDPRSLHLNFEITLAIYDSTFTTALEALQRRYAHMSRPTELAEWEARSGSQRFIENAARLFGPLL
jgi:cardiolipin synthase A/B